MGSQLYLKVNGVGIVSLKVRRKMVNGAPIGDRELVVEDPMLGKFAIDDNETTPVGGAKFVIEIRTDRREKWKTISVQNLLDMLENLTSSEL